MEGPLPGPQGVGRDMYRKQMGGGGPLPGAQGVGRDMYRKIFSRMGDHFQVPKMSGAIQYPYRLYKAPTDFTKPRQPIQSPDRLYKAPETLHKHLNIRQNLLSTRQAPKTFNKSREYYQFDIKYQKKTI